MIRIIVTSDSHKYKGKLLSIVKKHIEDANYFFNLGDCASGDDIKYIENALDNRVRFHCVTGNCDSFYSAPEYDFITIADKKILFCHGHTFKVKYTIDNLYDFAKKSNCDIALYGHTHHQYHEVRSNIHILCPGAVMNGEYGIVDIVDDKIVCINASL